MLSSLEIEIRERLGRYLSGETSLREFDTWFVPATWDVECQTDPRAYDTTNEIYLRLAEYSNGDWSEAELRQLLRELIAAPVAAQ